MAARVRFKKVMALPDRPDPDSFYYVEGPLYTESYLTDSSGVARGIGNTAMITSVVASKVADAIADYNSLRVVADIAARDALSKRSNFLALVVNATGDATVKSGSALYAWSKTDAKFYKVSEYESLDLTLNWSAIQGGPTSTPAQIDSAVAATHTHANKATLDKISEDADGLTFGGVGVEARWSTVNW